MREYRYHATAATIEALRRLRRAWSGYHLAGDAVLIALEDGDTVRLCVERADLEPQLEAFRLSAELVETPLQQLTAPGAFGVGGNDVVVFRSESWIEDAGEPVVGAIGRDAIVRLTGSPLQRSPSAAAVCAVDDAVVVATGAGTALLVRCGGRPGALEVTTEPAAISRFLAERQYRAGPSDS